MTPPRPFSALPPSVLHEASPKAISGRTSYLRVRLEFLRYPHLISTFFNRCEFGPPPPFTAASTWTWVGHPVSGLCLLTLISALLRLGFPSAPDFLSLTSPAAITRRTVLQKVRGRTHTVLPQLVNTGFQVLFHSPPGVLFTFPSQYYALSVTKEYLALRGGPRSFPQGSTCLVVLWILLPAIRFRIRGFHSLWLAFPKPFCYPLTMTSAVRTPDCTQSGLGSFPFARRYLGNHLFVFSSSGYLDVSVHRVPSIYLWIQYTVTGVLPAGFPHSDTGGSSDICSSPPLFAAYHVFLRLLVPRHPPCALLRLTFCSDALAYAPVTVLG